jgi:hypothetical protein
MLPDYAVIGPEWLLCRDRPLMAFFDYFDHRYDVEKTTLGTEFCDEQIDRREKCESVHIT